MENLQLYRTNVSLSGQMKFDIILSDTNLNDISVEGFNITPISDKVPFDRSEKNYLVNYKINESIKNYYHKVSGWFYNSCIDNILTQNAPLYNEYKGPNYDSTYEMGCKRMRYKLYNRQFSYFCPVWIEKIPGGSCLAFEFEFFSDPQQTRSVLKKYLKFKADKDSSDYHKNFVNKFNEYLSHLGTRVHGRDYVIDLVDDVNYGVVKSKLSAFCVKTGRCEDKKLPQLYYNLTNIQRPLMEQDYLLTTELENNKCITKQLLNLNFCFNVEDFLPYFTTNEFMGNNLYMTVTAYMYDGENYNKLPKKDIFSNYEYISRRNSAAKTILVDYEATGAEKKWQLIPETIHSKNSGNVLTYLHDNNCLDFMNKNKLVQRIHHWCPSYNPNEVFNFYPGFMSSMSTAELKPTGTFDEENNEIYVATDNIILYEGDNYNEDTPHINADSYNETVNPYWCNTYEMPIWIKPDESNPSDQFSKDYIDNALPYNIIAEAIVDILMNSENYKDLYSEFSKNCYVKNVHYKYTSDSGLTSPYDKWHTLFLIPFPLSLTNEQLGDKDWITLLSGGFDISKSNQYITTDNKVGYVFKPTVWGKFVENIIKSLDLIIDKKYSFIKRTCVKTATISAYKFIQYTHNNYSIWIYNGYIPTQNQSMVEAFRKNYNKYLLYKKFKALNEKLKDPLYPMPQTSTYPDYARAKNDLLKIINSAKIEELKPVYIYQGLTPIKADGPSFKSTEILYNKTNKSNMIFRNIGKLKPKFIDPNDPNEIHFNYLYGKVNINKLPPEDIEKYIKFSDGKYPPIYPSIGYYNIFKEKQLYNIGELSQQSDSNINLPKEYHFMDSNCIMVVRPSFYVELDSLIINGSYEPLDGLVNDYLRKYYEKVISSHYSEEVPETLLKNQIDYIISLYEYDSSIYDTFIDENGYQSYKYKVEINLK